MNLNIDGKVSIAGFTVEQSGTTSMDSVKPSEEKEQQDPETNINEMTNPTTGDG